MLPQVTTQYAFTEELPMHRLKPDEYMAVTRRATELLHWQVTMWHELSLICNTPSRDLSEGAVVTIIITENKVMFYSKAINEYYDDNQHREHAEQLKRTVAILIEEAAKADRNLHPMHREKYGALLPSKSYIVTPVINYINVLIFAAMVLAGLSPLHPSAQSLFTWGGNLRPAVVSGDWWRLVSYMFVHSGIMHLAMNTFAMLYIGMFLEPLLGRFRFASAYLLSGVCAGLLSIVMHPGSVGVGASGAIFGMYGVFLSVLTTTHIQRTLRKTMLRSILFFVVLNLMTGLQGNIDNAAHIGGLISGILIGYAYYPGITAKAPIGRQALVTLGLLAGVVVIGAIVVAHLR